MFPATLDITQFFAQLSSRLILQLIKGISSDCQKLLRYFGGTFIVFHSLNSFIISNNWFSWNAWFVFERFWVVCCRIVRIASISYNISFSTINVFVVFVGYTFCKWCTVLNATLVFSSPLVAVMSPVTRIYESK